LLKLSLPTSFFDGFRQLPATLISPPIYFTPGFTIFGSLATPYFHAA